MQSYLLNVKFNNIKQMNKLFDLQLQAIIAFSMTTQNSQQSENKKRVKVVLLGDRSVGKSSIINRFITDHFEENLQPTVGVDFMGKNITYKGQNYRIELWDTAGQQKYRSLVKGYLKGADACVLVYDCSSISSYTNLPDWLNLFDSVGGPDTYKVIVGNKCDAQFNSQNLEQSKKTLKSQHQELRSIPEFVSSAKLDINIAVIFQDIMHNFVNKKSKGSNSSNITKIISQVTGYTKNSCCK